MLAVRFVRKHRQPGDREARVPRLACLQERFGHRGMHAGGEHAPRHRRKRLYLELLPRVNAAEVELPDDPALLRELRAVERRRGPSGRDRVDHARGAHDDRANAVAGVTYALLGRPLYTVGGCKF